MLEAAFPKSSGYVTDRAGILDKAAAAEIEGLLRDVERDTSAEVALVTVPSLDGMTVEEYANRLFAIWGIGKKSKDNGVLLLIAPSERRVRIEVGYGLEPILPDGLAGEIIRAEILPEFRNGHYTQGARRGVERVVQIVRRDPAATASNRGGAPRGDRRLAWLLIPFLGIFVAAGAFGAGIGLRTKAFGALLWGALFGGVPLVIALLSSTVASAVVLVPLGLALMTFGYTKGRSSFWSRTLRGSSTASAGDSWVMGGTSDSGDGGSSDSSSGGDFGGGSSGGGGASGSW
jgi:uncharacterized protein